jgi:GTP-binding protein
MINFRKANFIKSAPNYLQAPKGNLPEVLICGKSNVGKSSLINALCDNKSLAYTSSKPGHTRLLNYYDIDSKFFLVDAPGYGYAKGGLDLDRLFAEMMDSYFSENPNLKLVLILLDSRREMNENDLEMLQYCLDNDINYLLVVTKTDKINQSEKAKLFKHLKSVNVDKEKTFLTSIMDKKSLVSLKGAIEKLI